MKKPLPTEAITSELNRSVFFQNPPADQVADQPHEDAPNTGPYAPPPFPPAKQQTVSDASQQDGTTDVKPDVMTSKLEDATLKQWQEVIENTETQNSALRLTSEERYAVEDVVNELRRKYGIKTSMNEVARLGLLLLIQDFKQQKKASIIHKVKKA